MGVTLLDSAPIVAFLDMSNVFHTPATEAITGAAAAGTLIASAVTYAEMLTGAELGHHDKSVVLVFFQRVFHSIIPVDRAVAERASELRGGLPALKMPDALILATADLHATEAITCDQQWAKPTVQCKVRVLNDPTR